MILNKSGKRQAQDCKYAQFGAAYWLCTALFGSLSAPRGKPGTGGAPAGQKGAPERSAAVGFGRRAVSSAVNAASLRAPVPPPLLFSHPPRPPVPCMVE